MSPAEDAEVDAGEIAVLGRRVHLRGGVHGYGLVTHIAAPGGIKIQLYEPRYKGGAKQ